MFHFDLQLTTFMFLCHTLLCVDINIVIIWMLSWIYFYCYSDAMNTTNLLTTVIIFCFLFVFSFLSWYWMEKISMEVRWSLLSNKSLYIRSCLSLRLQPYFDNIFRRFCILFSKAFVLVIKKSIYISKSLIDWMQPNSDPIPNLKCH